MISYLILFIYAFNNCYHNDQYFKIKFAQSITKQEPQIKLQKNNKYQHNVQSYANYIPKIS